MLHDFFTGYVGGLAGVVIGHPFDTIKVYIQTKKCHLGAIGTFRSIIQQEGTQGLFKGMTSPLFGTAFLCSILFGVNSICTKTLPEHLRNTVQGQTVAGSVAGFTQVFVTCPMELVKIRMQIKDRRASKTTLTRQTLEILREKSGFKTLFKGTAITIIRDIPGFGVYFGVNQYIINRYKSLGIERNIYNDMMCAFVAGGLAGVASWVPSYPLDVIKTRVQSCLDPKVDTRFIPFTRHLIQSEGIGVLTRGMMTQLVRAFPVNAFTFWGAAIAAYMIGSPSPYLL